MAVKGNIGGKTQKNAVSKFLILFCWLDKRLVSFIGFIIGNDFFKIKTLFKY